MRDENGYPKIENPRSLRGVAQASKECRGCHLWARATQTVFGEGPRSADLLFVGEQPGDKEDLAGRPFVGPAGRILDDALASAGIDRKRVFVTNAVKHFARTDIVVALGATAAQALLGRSFRVTKERGKLVSSPLAERVVATVHPSSILRAPDDDSRRAEMRAFVRDLRKVAQLMR